MKFLIFGLGNIGPEYQNTRHNVGFMVLDALAKASNIFFTPDKYAETSTLKHKGKSFILVKPNTYMNLSGKAVNYWMQKEKVSVLNTLVITDDLALPFGTVRLRAKGSDGGHNGLKNINDTLGHQNYARLRFGIGNEFNKGSQVNYVLSAFDENEQKILPQRIQLACDATLAFGTLGINRAMSEFNNK